jgi:hypothetical protein
MMGSIDGTGYRAGSPSTEDFEPINFPFHPSIFEIYHGIAL